MSPAHPSATGIYRPNVAAIITNDDGQALICERADVAEAWQFPQGGLLPGEDPQAGLARELEEELSLRPADYAVGERRGPYRYLFVEGRTKDGFRGQEQWYFRVRLLAPDSRINVATAHREFQTVRWIDPTNFDLAWVFERKRDVYRQVFRDFFAVSLPPA